MRYGFLALVLLLLFGCAPTIPDWVDGNSKLYPDDQYLVGIGHAPIRGDAEDRARAAVAKTFAVQVQSRQSSSEVFWMARVGETESKEYRQDLQSDLVTRTDRLLTGVRIAEVWASEEDGIYALALLDRVQAMRPLKQQLTEIDLAVEAEINKAEASEHAIEQLGHLLKALQLLGDRGAIAADLAILMPTGYVTAAPQSSAQVAERADAVAATISIGLEMFGDEQGIVEGEMISALNKISIKLVSSGKVDMTIVVEVRIDEYQVNDPWHWALASAQTTFMLPEGRILDAMRTNIREGSQVESRARVLALEKVGKVLATAVIDRIVNLGLSGE